jgi:hypothetical protein
MMNQIVPVNLIRTYTLIYLFRFTLDSVDSCSGSFQLRIIFYASSRCKLPRNKKIPVSPVNYFANLNAKFFEEITGDAYI